MRDNVGVKSEKEVTQNPLSDIVRTAFKKDVTFKGQSVSFIYSVPSFVEAVLVAVLDKVF
ncbi:hypothetical protein [Bacillus sp. FJAT-27445]|uniref:hypothetical protein n=1 Tax=Bacillus sp. FJAT-27445 TaxID=1679166 RepID=UPI000743EBB2|nr:hypothetical protein [Bacillus sp. FJAT-27445]